MTKLGTHRTNTWTNQLPGMWTAHEKDCWKSLYHYWVRVDNSQSQNHTNTSMSSVQAPSDTTLWKAP